MALLALSRRSLAVAVAALGVAIPAQAQVDESALKAAFVYNIVAFAQWNAPRDPRVLTLCTDAGPALDSAMLALDGRALGERRLAVRLRPQDPGCDVVVHGRDRPTLPAAGVLLVCDGCDAADAVTAVALVRQDSKVRFDIGAAAAARAGITFSSQLLRLARRVL